MALKLVAAGEESARRAAREVAMAVATGVARPLEERLSLEAESCQHCQHRVSEMAREAAAEAGGTRKFRPHLESRKTAQAEVVKHAVLKAEVPGMGRNWDLARHGYHSARRNAGHEFNSLFPRRDH